MLVLILFWGISSISYAAPDVPSYAKWGQLAVKTAKKQFPKADIIDYLHIGRIDGPKQSTEKFKLWLKEEGKEFGLYIDIEFDPKNNDVKKITVKKSSA